MSHNFVKQTDGSKVCSNCGDERGVDIDRSCPHPREGICNHLYHA